MADSLETARERFDADDYARAREAALEGLRDSADDVELLRLAGRAGVETGADDAVEQLQRVTELAGDDAQSWRDLGDALAAEGKNEEARAAFEKVVELDPEDATALMHLGHSAAATGAQEDAVSYLSQAAEREPASRAASSAAISLVDMHRALGRPEEAFASAKQVADAQPDDVLAQLDVAELGLELGNLDDAEAAFDRLREIDEVAEHEIYALHGLAQVAMRRGDTQRALELAREAIAIDERGRSADLLLHLEVAAGAGDDALEGRPSAVIPRMPPSPDEMDAALTEGLQQHRRLHVEDRRLLAEDLLG